MAAGLGDLVAPLIGAGPAEVVFQPNVTIAHAVVFSAFDFGARPAEGRHRRDALPLDPLPARPAPGRRRRGRRRAERRRRSPSTPAGSPRRSTSGRPSSASRTSCSRALISTTWRRSAGGPREVGAVSIVDGYQAVGVIPVDVAGLGVDVYIGGCLKWLCGGPGAAFLWVRPGLRAAYAPPDRLDGARAAVRLRARRWSAGTTPGGSCTGPRTSRPSTRRGRGWRSSTRSASSAIRAKSVRQTPAADRAGRRARPPLHGPPRPRPAGRDGRPRRAARPGGLAGPEGAGRSSATTGRGPASASRPTSTRRDDELDEAVARDRRDPPVRRVARLRRDGRRGHLTDRASGGDSIVRGHSFRSSLRRWTSKSLVRPSCVTRTRWRP